LEKFKTNNQLSSTHRLNVLFFKYLIQMLLFFVCTVLAFVLLIMHVFYFCYVSLYNYDFMYVL